MTLVNLTLVGVGGFLGAIFRYVISKYLNNNLKSKVLFPLGTLTVNLLGAFLLGLIIGAKADSMIMLLLGTGFMGAFTNIFNAEVRNDTIICK